MIYFIPPYTYTPPVRDEKPIPTQTIPSRDSLYRSSISSYAPASFSLRTYLVNTIQHWKLRIQQRLLKIQHFFEDAWHVTKFILKKALCCIRLPNFYRVSQSLYRGGQPSKKGFKELEQSGIKAVISLRKEKSDRPLLKNRKLKYFQFFFGSTLPSFQEILRFLKIVTSPENIPAFVHCYFGADRTGLACALYRIFVEGWSKERALREMKEPKYGFHHCYQQFADFIAALDVRKYKEALKLA